MGLEAQRIIDVIRQAVSQMTRNGAMMEYVRGQAVTGGAYQVSAYVSGSDVASDYISVTDGIYVPAGAYVEIVREDEDQRVTRVLPSLFSRLAVDVLNGRVYTGDGLTEVSDPGVSGYALVSGGPSGSMYWAPVLDELSSSTPNAVSTSGAAGVSASASRGDHTHAHEAAHIAHDTLWDAKGDLVTGSGADTAVRTAVGANDTIVMADSAAGGGVKWVGSQTPSNQAFGDSAAEGTADTYSRGDHKHGMPPSTSPYVQVFTGNGTWTKPAGALYVVVECLGPGGAGGGAPATGASTSSTGSGGGAGGYAKKTFGAAALPASCTVVVGSGGTGSSGNDGNDGSADTTFSGSFTGSPVSGGAGGGGRAGSATAGNNMPIVGSGGSASGGDINITGGAGNRGSVTGGGRGNGGHGASSMYGSGGTPGSNAVGGAAVGYGAGGGSPCLTTSQSAFAGGAGTGGICIVTTFYQ